MENSQYSGRRFLVSSHMKIFIYNEIYFFPKMRGREKFREFSIVCCRDEILFLRFDYWKSWKFKFRLSRANLVAIERNLNLLYESLFLVCVLLTQKSLDFYEFFSSFVENHLCGNELTERPLSLMVDVLEIGARK